MQITIYVNEELARELDHRAREWKVSRSQVVQRLLREGLAGRKPERLLQAFGKIPELSPDLRAHLGADALREQLS